MSNKRYKSVSRWIFDEIRHKIWKENKVKTKNFIECEYLWWFFMWRIECGLRIWDWLLFLEFGNLILNNIRNSCYHSFICSSKKSTFSFLLLVVDQEDCPVQEPLQLLELKSDLLILSSLLPSEPNGDLEEHASMLAASPRNFSIIQPYLEKPRKIRNTQDGKSTEMLLMFGKKLSKKLMIT